MDNETQLRACCGVAVLDDNNRVLLMRRRGDETWGIPGGGIEGGEAWRQAARRECREETGRAAQLQGRERCADRTYHRQAQW
ncbi:NUDIX domain-containing protein [Actinoplanes sp. NPDC051470]|uniref:NUDIX domain-containing protein n=1 Tax=Actinoplanes sp. NPDC051470 TaxID=3157224 RepID=UPI00342E6959